MANGKPGRPKGSKNGPKSKDPSPKKPLAGIPFENIAAPRFGVRWTTRNRFDPDSTPEVVYYLAVLGMSEREIWETFGISETGWIGWKKRYPLLKEALVAGRDQADAQVAAALYRKATGSVITQTSTTEVFKPNGDMVRRVVTKTETEVPPDTQAAKFWLINRQRETSRWLAEKRLAEAQGDGPDGAAPLAIEYTVVEEDETDYLGGQ